MSPQETEQDRIRRIRGQQISARDPLAKDRRISKKVAARRKKKRDNENFMLDSIQDVPKMALGRIIGLFLGFVVILILPYIFEGSWVFIVSMAVTLVLIIIGIIFGAALDWRDDLRDL